MESGRGELVIFLIYSKNAINIKRFILSLPKSAVCINYMDILNRLSKNDYLQLMPSDEVVSTHLMKKLQTTFEKNKPDSLYYVLSDATQEVIGSIFEYIKYLHKENVKYIFYHTPEVNVEEIKHLFSEVIEFSEYEKT